MNKSIFFILLCIIALFSCATQRDTIYVSKEFLQNIEKNVDIGDVSVVIDFVSQKDLAMQILHISKSIIRNMNNPTSDNSVVTMNISISQRAFLDGIEPKNSIFIDVVLLDKNGMLVGTFNKALVGKETIVSSVVQFSQMADVCEAIFKTEKGK